MPSEDRAPDPEPAPPTTRLPEPVSELLADLEMQAEGLHLADRAAAVDALSVAGYAEVDLRARLHGSLGVELRVALAEGPDLHGRLSEVGSDWLALADGQVSWYVPLPGVVWLTGLGSRAVPEDARAVTARLPLRAALRRLAEGGEPCAVHLRGGRILQGLLGRVGADFAEVVDGSTTSTVPVAAILAVRARV